MLTGCLCVKKSKREWMHWEKLMNALLQCSVCRCWVNLYPWKLVMPMMCRCGQLKSHKQHLINLWDWFVCSCMCSNLLVMTSHLMSGVMSEVLFSWAKPLICTTEFTVWATSLLTPVTLDRLEMRERHLTCVATAGTVGGLVNAGDAFFRVSLKNNWTALFNCCVEYCNYKTASQISKE